MARYLYSELSNLIQARRNCAQHKYDVLSVAGGWQTRRVIDGAMIGPVCNSTTDVWEWQRYNIPTTAGEWFDKHTETIEQLCKQHLPSGSGFDSGTQFDIDASHGAKLVFHTSFHHMDDNGMYSGWTDHTVTVTPSFTGIDIRVSGRNRNDIKEYIHEEFSNALETDVTYDLFLPHYPQFAVTSKWEDKDGAPSQCYKAFYVGEHRFWNDPFNARKFAASQMEIAHTRR